MAMMGDQITMKDGQVMVVRDGETTPMEEDVTMADGTRVMRNGQVLMANGTARMMREGETLTLDREPTEPEEMTDRQFKETMEDEELRDQLH
jgi:chromosome condensin MukBEF MukE localization factor